MSNYLQSDEDKASSQREENPLVSLIDKWSDIIDEVTLTAPPGLRTIIITLLIASATLLGIIWLRGPWYGYLAWAVTILGLHLPLIFVARGECSDGKNETQSHRSTKKEGTRRLR